MLYILMTLLAAQPLPQAAQAPCGDVSVLVRMTGFRNRTGNVRVRLFGGATSSYFDKKQVTVRREVPLPRSGPVTLCMPAPRPGVYAIDVRHDVNGDGKTDRGDGGGISGNPRVGLMDVIFKRRPEPGLVQVRIGQGVTTVPIQLKYLQGGSFKAVPGTD